ncbi:hypothetical protein LPB137_04080 [Poseidonibacter parvus]|uniref:DUF2237 domain-containing protein n=1 Tax=Poseidonibacter parvus TaxID=1850254 RepID=A0A1P8KKK8_9BACT|nr:DUF2237 domain-containing protein [Poseidonibacter parvus]APW65074.1 hypothetical protein LPB137_04080 [Poseidonibacter parvus]
MQTNILGTNLELCCSSPITGFYRDGICRTSQEDTGTHTICAILTNDFLQYSKSKGNDLTTPMPQYGFPGLKEGDKWCLCALRWKESYEANCAPNIIAEATSIATTKFIEKEILLKYAI